jgi:hypothetical protein
MVSDMKTRGSITEDLKRSNSKIGAIYPILKTPSGEIIDGNHRSKIAGWKTETVNITDRFEILRLKVHANMLRREVSRKEKESWITDAFSLLEAKLGRKPFLTEVADELGLSPSTVNNYNIARSRQLHAPASDITYYHPCKDCGSTAKKCYPYCRCFNCQNKKSRGQEKAMPVDYDRQPIFTTKLICAVGYSAHLNIPADICRKLDWKDGDEIRLTVKNDSILFANRIQLLIPAIRQQIVG